MSFILAARLWVCIAILGIAIVTPNRADASGVTYCNDCGVLQLRVAATKNGPGFVYVIDDTKKKLRLYEVFYESPPPAFLQVVERPVPADVSEMYLHAVEFAASSASTITVPIDATNPPQTGPGSQLAPFVNSGIGAFEIANSITIRNNIELALATTPASGNSFVDAATRLLQSVFFGGVSSLTGAPLSYTFVITWEDGSRTTFKYDAEDLTRAEYQQGESLDADGNPVPDGVIQNPDIGPMFQGLFEFQSNQTFDDFVAGLLARGVPITGTRSNATGMVCIWDPTTNTLTCSYYSG